MGTRVSAKQYAVPAAMLVVGVAAFVVRQGTEAHWHSQGFVSAFAGLVAGVAFSLGGTFLLTALTGTSFGSRDRPVLEFTAIFVFVTGLTALVPSLAGHAVALLLYMGLLMWRFSLNLPEAVPYVGTMWLARFVALIAALTIPLLSEFARRY